MAFSPDGITPPWPRAQLLLAHQPAPATISFASCWLCLALCPAAALIHAFVISRLDHCSSILVGLPLALTARLDRVLRCAARLIGRIPKYGSVSAYMRDTLHWLPIAQRISYRQWRFWDFVFGGGEFPY